MRAFGLAVLAGLGLAACGGEAADLVPGVSAAVVRPVQEGYAAGVGACYGLAVDRAQALDRTIAALSQEPTELRLAAARAAWLEARDAYGMTEAFRFYGGPIDHPAAGVEHLINPWPVDGSAVAAGDRTEPDKRKMTGWHALGFLLWGPAPVGRPASDFEDPARAAHLQALSNQLLRHLEQLADAWTFTTEERRYYSAWVELAPGEAVARAFTGIVTLAADEVAERRLSDAWEANDPTRAYARFSESTRPALIANLHGLELVYSGDEDGPAVPGLDTLVALVDPALDAAIQSQIEKTRAALDALPASFRDALSGADDAPGRAAIKAAAGEWRVLAQLLVDAARALGVKRALPGGA